MGGNMYKYSVIIPVYNSESTIVRCLESIVSSKFNSVEIVIVNDGSSDDSDLICRSYAEKYSCIKYIAKDNGGVSTARNIGIQYASGKYIMFADSDDYVSENYFHVIEEQLLKHDADLTIFSFCEDINGAISEHHRKVKYSDDLEETFKIVSESIANKVINSPCAKVYKKSIIDDNNISFTEGVSIGEDRAFNIKYALCIKSIFVSDTCVYYVCLDNQNSLSRGKQKNLEQQFAIADKDIYNAISNSALDVKYKSTIYKVLNFCKLRSVYKKAKDMHRENVSFITRLKRIRALSKEINSNRYEYPDSLYCKLITAPVKYNIPIIIDVIAWKLTH